MPHLPPGCIESADKSIVYAEEALTAEAGPVLFRTTGLPAPGLDCSVMRGTTAVVYPASHVLLQVYPASGGDNGTPATTCKVTRGPKQERVKAKEIILGNGNGETTMINVGVGDDPVFGMVLKKDKSVLVEVSTGEVLVGKDRTPVGKNRKVTVSASGKVGKVIRYTTPDAALQSGFLAVQPNLCPKDIPGLTPTGTTHPQGLAQDTHGNIWFTNDGAPPTIGEYRKDGTSMRYTVGDGLLPGAVPRFITGPDVNGNIWFTDDGSTPAIGEITPGAANPIHEYPLPTEPGGCPADTGVAQTGHCPWAPVVGAHGNIYFSDRNTTAPAIGVFSTASSSFSQYTLGLNPGSDPEGIAVLGDKIWFTDDNDPKPAIGLLDTTANPPITEYSTGLSQGNLPRGIATGPDGNIWFADEREGAGLIGMLDPATASSVGSREFGILANGGLANSVPEGLASDGANIWFTDQASPSGAIGFINPHTGGIIERVIQTSDGRPIIGAKPIGIIVTSSGELRYLDQESGAPKITSLKPASAPCS
jgi:streptogramin lyase